MMVERASLRAVDIRSVSVEAVMGRWLAFSNVLAMAAEDAVSKGEGVSALAVQVGLNLERFAGLLALERLARGDNSAAFVLGVA